MLTGIASLQRFVNVPTDLKVEYLQIALVLEKAMDGILCSREVNRLFCVSFFLCLYPSCTISSSLDSKKIKKDIDRKSASVLFDESWLSADSFMHHLCKDFFQLILEVPVVDGDLLSWVLQLSLLH